MTVTTALAIFLTVAISICGAAVITVEMVDGADRGDALYGSVEDDPPQRRHVRI